MGLSEALSDDGAVSGRGNPVQRGLITGVATAIGGMFHTLPFLIAERHLALSVAYAVVVIELLAIAWIKWYFMGGKIGAVILQIVVGGAIVCGVGLWLGHIGAG